MYENIERVQVPEGLSISQYIHQLMLDIKRGIDVEENIDKVFKVSYPIAVTEALRYKESYGEELVLSVISIAFMKTFNNYNIQAENFSFLNYYRRAITTEIVWTYYGRYISTQEGKDLKRFYDLCTSSLDDTITDKDGDETSVYSIIPSNDPPIDKDILLRELIEDIYSSLDKVLGGKYATRSPVVRKAIIAFLENIIYDKGLTQVELGKSIGISRSYYSNIIYKYMPRLKQVLQDKGYNV